MSGFVGTQGVFKPTNSRTSPELPSQSVSIGIAMISHKAAVVCSDGLVCFPDTPPETNFNKTFSVGEWIGVCTGVMDLGGNTPQAIIRILQSNPSLQNLTTECRKLLTAHSCNPDEKHIEILLAGKGIDGPAIHRIILHLDEKNDSIKEFPLSSSGARSYVLIGEEKARQEAARWIDLSGNFERKSKASASHLRKMTMEAIGMAVLWCGDHPSYAGYKACGGRPFSDTIGWKTGNKQITHNENNIIAIDFPSISHEINYNEPKETIKTRRKQKHGRTR